MEGQYVDAGFIIVRAEHADVRPGCACYPTYRVLEAKEDGYLYDQGTNTYHVFMFWGEDSTSLVLRAALEFCHFYDDIDCPAHGAVESSVDIEECLLDRYAGTGLFDRRTVNV